MHRSSSRRALFRRPASTYMRDANSREVAASSSRSRSWHGKGRKKMQKSRIGAIRLTQGRASKSKPPLPTFFASDFSFFESLLSFASPFFTLCSACVSSSRISTVWCIARTSQKSSLSTSADTTDIAGSSRNAFTFRVCWLSEETAVAYLSVFRCTSPALTSATSFSFVSAERSSSPATLWLLRLSSVPVRGCRLSSPLTTAKPQCPLITVSVQATSSELDMSASAGSGFSFGGNISPRPTTDDSARSRNTSRSSPMRCIAMGMF